MVEGPKDEAPRSRGEVLSTLALSGFASASFIGAIFVKLGVATSLSSVSAASVFLLSMERLSGVVLVLDFA